MKQFKVICGVSLLLLLVPGTAVAQISYSKDFIEAGNPGGLGMCEIIDSGCSTDSQCADGELACLQPSLKTFEDTWTMSPGETVDVDIWLTDVPEDLLTAGFFILYDPALVSITNVVPYDTNNGGPWDAGYTSSFEVGPGEWFLVLANFSCVSPDGDGDIILGTVTFQCQGSGNADIINVTIIDFATVVGCFSGTTYDPQIAPNIVTIIQTCSLDAECNDGVACTDDACVSEVCENTPNDANCPDDGLYCNGVEVCDPDNDCISTGDPCIPTGVCDEESDQCVLQPCTVAVFPSSATVFTWETVQFSATVDGGCFEPCFTWEISVQESTGSTINQTGLYTAGGNQGTDVIQVTDICNGNISDSATVDVLSLSDSCEGRCGGQAPAGCFCDEACHDAGDCCPDKCEFCYSPLCEPCQATISPSFISVPILGTVQFDATVDGTCNEPCFTWEIVVQESTASSIDGNGLYTAGDNAGTDIIQVIDPCNTGITDIAVVNVMKPVPLDCTKLLASSQFNELFRIDVTTGEAEFIGFMPSGLSTEIEYDILTGTLYAEEVDGLTSLHTIDPETGISLGFVTHEYGSLNGLEFVDSTLYGAFISGPGGPSVLVIVDTSTGALTPIGPTGFGPVSGLAYDGGSGVMYGITAGGSPANLVTIDLTTGAATIVGPTDLDRIGSIEFGPDGNLYGGVTAFGSSYATYLVRIDTATGAVTPIGETGFSITGLTSCQAGEEIIFEIKPDPLNLKCKGVMPAAIVGTDELDVTSIDPDSLRLTREGVTDSVAPIRYSFTDQETGDMLLKFRAPEVVEVLQLNELAGQTIPLTITGRTADGVSIRGQDTVRLLGDIVEECNSDFDCDADVDGSDALTFKGSFGRSSIQNPCTDTDPCDGDFDKDRDVDGNDAFVFKADYGKILWWQTQP